MEIHKLGWLVASGHEIAIFRQPYAVSFRCDLTDDWRTMFAEVRVTKAVGMRELRMGGDPDFHEWWPNGRRRRELDGCVDVDVAATALTNTFPIRRLGLKVGEARTIPVAWVDVPSLRVRRVEQAYRRVAEDVYEYSTATYGPARLTVDEDGIVIDYEGFAERIRQSPKVG